MTRDARRRETAKGADLPCKILHQGMCFWISPAGDRKSPAFLIISGLYFSREKSTGSKITCGYPFRSMGCKVVRKAGDDAKNKISCAVKGVRKTGVSLDTPVSPHFSHLTSSHVEGVIQ